MICQSHDEHAASLSQAVSAVNWVQIPDCIKLLHVAAEVLRRVPVWGWLRGELDGQAARWRQKSSHCPLTKTQRRCSIILARSRP